VVYCQQYSGEVEERIVVLIEHLKRVRILARERRARWVCGAVGRVCV
jgi:hypothetical protein